MEDEANLLEQMGLTEKILLIELFSGEETGGLRGGIGGGRQEDFSENRRSPSLIS